MRLSAVLSEILDDLPFSDHVRLVVGPLASRESVKDQLLARATVVPAASACTFQELARDILNKSKVSVDKSLSAASQCDAIERVASSEFLRDTVPDLCTHLKTRAVSMKVAKFLTQLERFYVHDDELDALVEYFYTRDASLGSFAKVIVQLWRQGELAPWGEGFAMRKLLELFEAGIAPGALPRRLWLWGFFELTPLEERVLEQLAAQGVEVRLLLPPGGFELLGPRSVSLGVEPVRLEKPLFKAEVWEPHSAWDELEFLRERLSELRQNGVRWEEIAIFVPNDDLYKRFARSRLHRWNVPLHDPTLSGAWKDNAVWLWWRDLLRTVANGLKLDEVRSWLGPGAGRRELFEAAFQSGVHGGAGQWARLLRKHPHPELQLLVEAFTIFGRAMKPAQFLEAAEKFVPRLIELLGEQPGADLFLEFARSLAEERPYLENFRGRLPRFVPLFEEFLEAKSRTQSLRCADGVHFVGHHVWLPFETRHAFVLGANTISRPRPPADIWDWEAVEVRRIWDKLHFGLTPIERAARDEAFLRMGLQSHGSVVYSACEYDLGGSPLPKAAFYQKLKGDKVPVFRGGHSAVGWVVAGDKPRSDTPAALERPDLAPAPDKGVRVSSFEDYLKCPFLYFARHVLKLEVEDELGLDPDGRARGTILHRVLERLLAEEIGGRPLTSPEEARARLGALVDEEVNRRNLTGMYRHEPLIEKAKAVIRAHAEKWLEWELENREKHPELKPYAVEKEIEIALSQGLKLRGKADRVDSDGKHAVVIDYKSGGAPLIGRELQEGLGAQLLMYAHGIQRKEGLEPGAAFYLKIGQKIDGSKGVFLKKHQKRLHTTNARNSGLYDGEFGTLFEKVTENWLRAAEALQRGDFAPRPARPKKDCPSCAYREICGHQAESGGEGE